MSRPLALLLTLSFLPAAAQSFDCKLAQSPREHAICSNPKLAALDSEIGAGYKSLRSQLSPESAAEVQSGQREWLHWLDLVCPAHGKGLADNQTRCLQNEYFTRAHDLEHVTRVGSTVIFLRAHFLYKPGGQDDNPADNDPGFGYGSLRWPQIDHPNAAQRAFNIAVTARASKLAVGFSEDKNATFDTAVDASGTIEANYQVEAVNGRFIDINLSDMRYGWGAAHPLTDRNAFLWWFDRNRELIASDVFPPNSDWKDRLATLAEKNLRSQSDLRDMLGDDIHKAVHETVPDPTNWTLTRDGLTITFGQYAIGPYSIGMPQAHIPWDRLAPYLEPTFHPSTLPLAIKSNQ